MYCSKSREDRSSLDFEQQFSSSPHWIFFRVLFFSSPIESFLCSRATLVIWLFSQSYSETELDTIWDTCFRSWIEFCNFCFLEFPPGFVLCLRCFEFFKSQISYLNHFFFVITPLMTKICLQPQREIIFLEVGKRNNFIDTELLQIAYRDSVEVQSYTQVQLQCGLHDRNTSMLWFRKPVACETTPHC